MNKKELHHSLNKSQIAKKLQERFSEESHKMSMSFASRILDELFLVAQDEGERDGIIVEQLRQEMEKYTIDKVIERPEKTKSFRYKDLLYNKVTIPDFGTFKVAFRAARSGTHPSEQKTVQIDETFVITFHPGKALKQVFKKGSSKGVDAALKTAQKAHKMKESIRVFKSKKK